MSSPPAAAKRLESAISICLLIILLFIGLGILIRQSDADMSRFGIDATAGEVSADRAKKDTDGGARLSTFAPSGFESIGQTQVYTAGNLYEKINGKADFYIDVGFEQLSTQRFIGSDNEALWMELYVYDMGSAESEELTNAASEVTQKIRTALVVEQDTKIAELSIFPAEGLVPDSFRLYPSDTFGFERLTNTFAARYKMDGEILTAFFSRRPDPQDAQNIAQAYHSFLLDSGCSDKKTTNQTLADLKANVVDAYGTTEIIFVTGPFVAGVHEADNQQAAEKLAEILALKLRSIAEGKGD
jgi:hypothetical protein